MQHAQVPCTKFADDISLVISFQSFMELGPEFETGR